MRAQLDPRSDWVKVTSSVDNPIMLLVLKDEVIAAKNFSIDDQNQILRDVVDEVGSSDLCEWCCIADVYSVSQTVFSSPD